MMKTARNIIISAAAALVAASCINLDLNPLDKPSTGNWYQDKDQIIMSLNNIQLVQFWLTDRTEAGLTADMDELTDDSMNRNSQNPFKSGTLTGDNSVLVKTIWSYTYKGISRCNAILDNMHRAKDTMSEEDYRMLEGCARFYRACLYSRICQLFGDPVFFLEDITLDVAYSTGRTPLLEALPQIMADFDYAAENCPASYNGQQMVTKGAALGMKARTALYFGTMFKFQENPDNENSRKYLEIARDASKACIDLNVYDLYPDFGELFLNKTHNTCEAVFSIARSYEYSGGTESQYLHKLGVTAGLPRMHGGYCSKNPTWDLLWAFTCDDGLPIDKSPRYNPKNPWENRDPRLKATILEPGTNFCGIVYDFRFDVKTVWSDAAGGQVANNDNILVNTDPKLPSRTGLIMCKGVDEDWTDDQIADPDKQILRFADVLLCYAEAKIELGETSDGEAVAAMNRVRARAYKTTPENVSGYPAISGTDQDALRTVLRTERRMELAGERYRLYDLRRWRIAETVLNYKEWGFAYNKAAELKALGHDFIDFTPKIDESGCPVMDEARLSAVKAAQPAHERRFFKESGYLWPVPTNDILATGENIAQNPGY